MKYLLILLFAMSEYCSASHMIGGEITWECAGANYIFTLKIYRDCRGAGFFHNAQVIDVAGHPSISSLTAHFVSVTDISPPGCGYNCQTNIVQGAVEEYVFRSNPVNLGSITPGPAGWTFSWTLCCRNNTINNVAAPGSLSMTLRSKMYSYNGQPATPCFDNSPAFSERPANFLCSGVNTVLNYAALDADLDSISYSWAQPADGSPSALINFSGGFTTFNQFPGNPVLDQSGIIMKNASTAGDYIACVKVSAYKCNVKVAEVFRDIQLMLANTCGSVMGGGLNANPAYHDGMNNPMTVVNDTFFIGDSVNYSIFLSDLDLTTGASLQMITANAAGVQLGDSGISISGCLNPPCAVLDTVVPITVPAGMAYELQWNPTCIHQPDSCNEYSLYNFVFTAKDDHCPTPGTAVFIYNVLLKGISIQTSGNTIFTDFPNGSLQWNLNGTPIPGAVDSFYVMIDSGQYSVTAILDGCNLLSRPFHFLPTSTTDPYTFDFSIQPNPSDGIFSVFLNETDGSTGVFKVADMTGKIIFNSVRKPGGGEGETKIDLSFAEKGMYTLIYNHNGITRMKKVVLY